ncbi:FtsX-like permease family protein [Pajaroellobacter abortibovis]|uniref:ABC transporter permease n=1 Tax=Pajaroellobacter abortibovis TaxID=1882918 RepID=A0A1L6MVX8_9BACT|nr:FtsX-like permease family protein [Pajaroellobacter abortibovis]APR99703.1 hypothetical protein BCY86_02700 [Pajaroellobacter abortibovis]
MISSRHPYKWIHRASWGFGIGFAALVYWTVRLPTLRGDQWSFKDTLIRVGALTTGVLFALMTMGSLIPRIFDLLERHSFISFVSTRHVRSQKSGFLTMISILSICGVAVSSCALSSVISIMSGFSHDLKKKILGNNAHIMIDQASQAPWGEYWELQSRIQKIPGVHGVTPVVQNEAMLSSQSNTAGVIVRGVETNTIGSVIDLPGNIETGQFDYLSSPQKLESTDHNPTIPPTPTLIIGRELAKTLHVYVGDEVTLISPSGNLSPIGIIPSTRKFRIGAIFYSGMYEYDVSYVYTTLEAAQALFEFEGNITTLDIRASHPETTEMLTQTIRKTIQRPDLRVRDWHEMNQSLFSALQLERLATFVILSIAIMVASFCILCTLLLMVTEKRKEIAILKAMGASNPLILKIFIAEGMIVGGIGTTFGTVTALTLCFGLKWFGLRLDPDVYYIDRLPLHIEGVDFAAVTLASMVICTLATCYPAYAASKLQPVEGLRYE